MMASAQRYRLLASLVSLALALLYLLVATENARADDLNPAADSALNSALQAAEAAVDEPIPAPNPAADSALNSALQAAAAAVDEPVPAPTSQQASTEQAANAAAEATQQQPRNLVISIRINSPGNDGPISQSNVAGSVAGASNDSSTGQGSASGAQQSSQQQAATDQAAIAAATATQAQPQNIVILIRINSPGDNGPIEQTNTAVAASNVGNVSATTQGESGNASADGMATTGASPDPRAAIGPPAQQDATPAAALPRMSVALLAPAAPRGAIATGHRIDRPAPAARTNHRPAGDSANSAPSSTQSASTGPSDRLAVVKSEAGEPLTQVKPARRLAAARGDGAASRDPGVGRRAVDVLGKLAPPTPLQASGSEKDVTNAVVLSLIAVLGAFAVFFGSTYLSSGLRLPDPRSWRHG
jgi:hypothetical protein